MHDLIERQAAIEALYNVLFDDDLKPTIVTAKQADTIMDSIRWLPSAQPDGVDLFPDVSEEYKQGYRDGLHDKPEPHWIPCSERLPELDEDGYSDKVLVCFSNFTGCEVCEYRECDDCHGWYVGDSDDNPEDVGVHVIAWMPLPEPYREEGEANEGD